ncbi:membrane or secreted protein [Rufibacter sp. DG15C]|uniref:membrane or secreted protein n=1 Tax=Rufibacter sp. DG15C TaxID=1379909 RepID=UPI0018D308C9|nr:membrane or secreted protein [Rufibacter sp. DG15C]
MSFPSLHAMNPIRTLFCLMAFCLLSQAPVWAQSQKGKEPELVYVDQQGILRWTKTKQEAAFFGVNYTVPFAYGYRSVKARGVNPEKAIDEDVYHLARLGFDAFRVHVWDTEISDSLGNLLENEHLRLFDYLVYKLKERNIRVLITPIAFWGNGWPEKDEKTPGFSYKYGKQKGLVEETAFLAQENYLKQFLNHVNPYTQQTYEQDGNVIATEINNEPQHSGPKARTTEYVTRMVAAVRGTGWKKPVFYNISESPKYADAIVQGVGVDGYSFQWYPTNLMANHSLQGNYLSHVDRYHIPFDTLAAFKNKALMVYEFDAADILGSYMYPAMAKSFRTAGFQWATQFAYDPMATAYGNTEYQTHYLNLAFTPAKAISLMIAGKAFHRLPLRKNFGVYPADSVFGEFRVSYKQSMSEMNTAQEFYYSGSTQTQPLLKSKLEHVAGVGSSPVVKYSGTGVYFLDKLEKGVWRLEVMPDAYFIRDPLGKASPNREVSRIQWQAQNMKILLAELGESFEVRAVNEGNTYAGKAKDGSFQVSPGAYILSKKQKTSWAGNKKYGNLRVNEFVAPQPYASGIYVTHEPLKEVSSGQPFTITAQVVGISSEAKVTLQLNNQAAAYKTIPMQAVGDGQFSAQVPADVLTPGQISYRILAQDGEKQVTFPGDHAGNPWAWDATMAETYQTFVAAPNGQLELFNATNDRSLFVFPNLWKSEERQLIASEKPGQLILKLTAQQLPEEQTMGLQHYIGDKLKGRQAELGSFGKLVIRVRSTTGAALPLKVNLVTHQATGFVAQVSAGTTFQNIEIPLSTLQPDAFMLLPRPYPGFHPFWFTGKGALGFQLKDVEKLQIYLGQMDKATTGPKGFEIESVWLEKK